MTRRGMRPSGAEAKPGEQISEALPRSLAELDPLHVRARLDLFLEAACEGIYDWNLASDAVWVSARLLEIFDIHGPGLTPASWRDLIHADDRGPYSAAMREHFRSDAAKLSVEYRVRSSDGSYRWVLDRSIAIRRADRRVSQVVGAVLDVTEQKRREADLARNAWVLENTLQHMAQGITMVDAELRLIACNRRCAELLALPEDLLAGAPPMADIFRFQAARGEYGEGDVEEWVERRVAAYGLFEPRRYERVRPDGTVLEVTGVPLPDGRGFVTTFTDITRRKQAEQKLLALATTDELTGLCNRRQFFDLSGTELSKAARHQWPFSVMFIDIDHFKSVNDAHGHAAGDMVLKEIARIISNSMRQADIVGRIGGEEFAVLLPYTSMESAHGAAERLRAAVAAAEVNVAGAVLRLTISIGVSSGNHLQTSLENTVARADRALYLAKERGRNRVETDDSDPARPIE